MKIRKSKVREELKTLSVVNHVLSKFCTKRRTEVYVPLTIYIKASIGYMSKGQKITCTGLRQTMLKMCLIFCLFHFRSHGAVYREYGCGRRRSSED